VQAGGETDLTDFSGYYRLSMDVGTYTVVANPNNNDSRYTMGQIANVPVSLGVSTTIANINISLGGRLRGFVTTNGTDPLPGVPILATSSLTGAEVGSFVTDSAGYFEFADLPLASYTLTPQLEVGESASPAQLVRSITTGGSTVFVGTFTVSSAFGTLSGTVKVGTSLIQTGVLIIAVPSPTTIGSSPPTNDSTLRNASTVFYSGSSESDGTYSLSLRGGSTYNVYAWYTSFSGNNPQTGAPKTATVTMTAGGGATVDFTW
jgi:hypothetical protein